MLDVQRLLSNEDGSSERSKRYYAALKCEDVLPSCLHVRRCDCDTSTTGKGVFAEVELDDTKVLLREKPLLSMQHEGNKQHCLVCSNCLRFIGGIEAQILHRLDQNRTVGSVESTAETTEVGHATYDDVSKNILKRLKDGCLKLPHSDAFRMPGVVSCPGGCEEAHFCSQNCAETHWNEHHSLLCMAHAAHPAKMIEFRMHASETNDIFYLAAMLISKAILSVEKKLNEGYTFEDAMELAWLPFSMGWKGTWWECIALPEDVPEEEEGQFRAQLKDLAQDSLHLFKSALSEQASKYPFLFSIEVWGSIVGMFELNNLDVCIASPVEEYFLLIDGLDDSERMGALQITQPLLDILDVDYDIPCSGTAFYAIQSCMNHSCTPNAEALALAWNGRAEAIIKCTRNVKKGEEITISYIDLDATCSERQRMLSDYGFRCRCARCELDRNARNDDPSTSSRKAKRSRGFQMEGE